MVESSSSIKTFEILRPPLDIRSLGYWNIRYPTSALRLGLAYCCLSNAYHMTQSWYATVVNGKKNSTWIASSKNGCRDIGLCDHPFRSGWYHLVLESWRRKNQRI
jgi:hypothetical protein